MKCLSKILKKTLAHLSKRDTPSPGYFIIQNSKNEVIQAYYHSQIYESFYINFPPCLLHTGKFLLRPPGVMGKRELAIFIMGNMGISRIFKGNKGNISRFFGELAIFAQVKDSSS